MNKSNHTIRNEVLGAALTIGGGACWGLSGSVGQYLFTVENMDTRWLVPIRLGCAGIILFCYCLVRYGKEVFRPWKTSRDRKDLVIYGLAGISLCQFLYFLTIQLSSAAMGTILQSLSPIFILLATCRIEKRRAGLLEISSIILALLGVLLIVTHGDLTHLAVSPFAILTGLACAFTVMIYNVAPAHLLDEYPVTIPQSWAFLMGSAVTMLIFRPWTWDYAPSPMGLIGIAFVVLVGNVLAFSSYMAGVHLVGPNRGILYGFSEPVTAAIVGALVFRNIFTIWDVLGFALVFLVMVLISRHHA